MIEWNFNNQYSPEVLTWKPPPALSFGAIPSLSKITTKLGWYGECCWCSCWFWWNKTNNNFMWFPVGKIQVMMMWDHQSPTSDILDDEPAQSHCKLQLGEVLSARYGGFHSHSTPNGLFRMENTTKIDLNTQWLNGGFHNMGVPQKDSLQWKLPLEWMIWGVHLFQDSSICQDTQETQLPGPDRHHGAMKLRPQMCTRAAGIKPWGKSGNSPWPTCHGKIEETHTHLSNSVPDRFAVSSWEYRF